MPWKECKPMDERLKFIARLLEGDKLRQPSLLGEFGPRTEKSRLEIPRLDRVEIPCGDRDVERGQTGVEMEALTAVQVGLLTIYDMCNAVDRGMVIENVRLEEKAGGKSGHWRRSDFPDALTRSTARRYS